MYNNNPLLCAGPRGLAAPLPTLTSKQQTGRYLVGLGIDLDSRSAAPRPDGGLAKGADGDAAWTGSLAPSRNLLNCQSALKFGSDPHLMQLGIAWRSLWEDQRHASEHLAASIWCRPSFCCRTSSLKQKKPVSVRRTSCFDLCPYMQNYYAPRFS